MSGYFGKIKQCSNILFVLEIVNRRRSNETCLYGEANKILIENPKEVVELIASSGKIINREMIRQIKYIW